MSFVVTYDISEIKQLAEDFGHIGDKMPFVFQGAVRELGLFIETQAKLVLTRKGGVDTGRLRASIGHGDDGIFNEEFSPGNYVVTVGTNVEYAPYMEFGFTMNTPHVAFIKGVGFRYIHPFSFIGYHFMEEASVVAQRGATAILTRQLNRVLQEFGF